MTQKHLSALLGFAFVASWIAFGFGNAILCLVGAAVFYAAASVLEGDIDLGELQRRARGGASDPAVTPTPAAYPRAPRVR